MPNEDQFEGKAREVGGSVQEKAGEVTGDEDLETRGAANKGEGKAQGALGTVKVQTAKSAMPVPISQTVRQPPCRFMMSPLCWIANSPLGARASRPHDCPPRARASRPPSCDGIASETPALRWSERRLAPVHQSQAALPGRVARVSLNGEVDRPDHPTRDDERTRPRGLHDHLPVGLAQEGHVQIAVPHRDAWTVAAAGDGKARRRGPIDAISGAAQTDLVLRIGPGQPAWDHAGAVRPVAQAIPAVGAKTRCNG